MCSLNVPSAVDRLMPRLIALGVWEITRLILTLYERGWSVIPI